jgi:hypothetical protein
MTDEPAPATVAVDPEIEMTDVVADAYDQEPAIEPATVGALNEKFASPNVFDTFDQVKVGVACPTVTVIVTVPPDT